MSHTRPRGRHGGLVLSQPRGKLAGMVENSGDNTQHSSQRCDPEPADAFDASVPSIDRSGVNSVGSPAGRDLLVVLQGDTTRRRLVDPGLAGGLREWLEDGISSMLSEPPNRTPVIVNKQAFISARPGQMAARGAAGSTRRPTIAMARRMLVDALFRQFVTTGRIDNPIEDGLAAIACEGTHADVLRFVDRLPVSKRRQLEAEITAHAERLAGRWCALPPGWLPRTQDRISIALAGGHVLLVVVLDLVVGVVSSNRASVGLIEVKSGQRRSDDRASLHFSALLETLRSGVPPSRVASYYTGSGEVDAEDITEAHLRSAVRRVLATTRLLCTPVARPERTAMRGGVGQSPRARGAAA